MTRLVCAACLALAACGTGTVDVVTIAAVRVDAIPLPTTTTTSTTTTTTTAPPATTTTTAKTPPRRSQDGGTVWDAIAACESGGNWQSQHGPYEGGVHFLNSTWIAAGGGRYADHAYQATREQQIAIAQAWLERTSWAQWPVCSRKVGAR